LARHTLDRLSHLLRFAQIPAIPGHPFPLLRVPLVPLLPLTLVPQPQRVVILPRASHRPPPPLPLPPPPPPPPPPPTPALPSPAPRRPRRRPPPRSRLSAPPRRTGRRARAPAKPATVWCSNTCPGVLLVPSADARRTPSTLTIEPPPNAKKLSPTPPRSTPRTP